MGTTVASQEAEARLLGVARSLVYSGKDVKERSSLVFSTE